MVESSADQVEEAELLEALLFGHETVKELNEFQEMIIAENGVEKMDVELILPAEELTTEIF